MEGQNTIMKRLEESKEGREEREKREGNVCEQGRKKGNRNNRAIKN